MFQCAPNLSDGRNPAILGEIRETLRPLRQVRLADLSADPDHNRLVASLLGTAAEFPEAIYRLFEVALKNIDISTHEGGHPRIGAVDVVPFIPLFGTPMEEAVALAREVGRGVAERFGVPVFLYEEAAQRPGRRLLPGLRAGQLAGVEERFKTPEGLPDYGPPRLHPRLGATIVGARKPLVAFNIVLASPDLELAKRIARKIRTSGEGPPGVRSIAVWLASRQRAQVSINFTEPDLTGFWPVFQLVREAAAAEGVDIESSELIGLASWKALLQVAQETLKLEKFQPSQVLESHFLGRTLMEEE